MIYFDVLLRLSLALVGILIGNLIGLVWCQYRWRHASGWTPAKIRNGRVVFDPPVRRIANNERLEVERKYRRGRLVAARYRKLDRWVP